MPGSEADAWKKEEMETRSRYAKRMGIEGETWFHSQGAEKPKKRPAGNRMSIPVATLTGRSRVFCNLPPQQKAVLPEKYW
jgi:hypothetical protein